MDIDYKSVNDIISYVFNNATKGDPKSVLTAIEKYFYEEKPMMIVGDVKGKVLEDLVLKYKPKISAELGGFFGYSAIFIGNLIKDDPESHYYSIEYDSVLTCVIEKMVKFAGLESHVTVINGDLRKAIPVLKNQYKVKKLDFLFIDHIKSEYVNDFNLANENDLLNSGSVVAADNILVPGAPEYKKHLESHPKYHSQLHSFNTISSQGISVEDAIMVSIAI